MKRILMATLAAVVAVAFSAPALFAGTETGPKVAMHLTAPAAKTNVICTTNSPNATGTACSNYVVNANLNQDYLIYVVVAQADTPGVSNGILGIELGIEYNGDASQGVDVQTWYWCTDGQEYPNAGPRGDWPAAGGGNRLTWSTCQETRLGTDGIHAVIGAFSVYAYSNDKFFVTPNRNLQTGPGLTVADCAGAEAKLDTTGVATGWVSFGTPNGCNPCTAGCPVPTLSTTWGKIKNKY